MIPNHTSRFKQVSRFGPPRSCQICLNLVRRVGCESDRSNAERYRSRRPQPSCVEKIKHVNSGVVRLGGVPDEISTYLGGQKEGGGGVHCISIKGIFVE